MPAKSAKQRKAAGAELGRRRAGQKPRLFKSLSVTKLRDFAKK